MINLNDAEKAIRNRGVYKATLKVADTRVCITLEAKNIVLGRHTLLGLCLSARDINTGRSGDEVHFPETEVEAFDAFKGFVALLHEKLAEINFPQK